MPSAMTDLEAAQCRSACQVGNGQRRVSGEIVGAAIKC